MLNGFAGLHPRSVGRASASLVFDVSLFLVIAAILVVANWSSIDARNIEYGDFAANSLLIQDAKQGRLLVGNYSRVGFNHPGPAILYVLAFGEALLFDRLHWVPSPFSGQLVALALYNAFWIVLIVRLWRSMAKDVATTIAGVATFVVGTAFLDTRFFDGPWFPHLYYFPFATFVFAAGLLATGRPNGMAALAISGGLLWNGHVAFGPITAVVLSSALIANWRQYRRTDPSRVVARPSWLALNRRALFVTGAVSAVFLTPLLVETMRRPPGPLHDYLQFGGGREPNTVKQSLRFTAMYWGGLPFLVLPVSFAIVIELCRFENADWLHTVRSLLAVGAGATLALTLYACFGVDILNAAYIGYFYCAIPVVC